MVNSILDEIGGFISEAQDKVKEAFNEKDGDKPKYSPRELSLVRTKLEEAGLWLNEVDAMEKCEE